MLRNLVIGGVVIGGGFLAWNWWKKQQEKKQISGLLPVGDSTIQLTTGIRPKVKKFTVDTRPKVKKFSVAVRPPAPKVKKFTVATRPPAPIPKQFSVSTRPVLRPVSLSECCESLCLPTLKRTTRPRPVLDQKINFMRNIIQSSDPATYC